MNKQGHLIMLRSGISFDNYCKAGFIGESQKNFLKQLRKILYFIKPGNYRGTGRGDFVAWPFFFDKNGVLHDHSDLEPGIPVRNIDAKKQLAVYDSKNTFDGEEGFVCLHSLEEAKHVLSLMEDNDDYEIIEVVENESTINERTIGFDIGYLGGDFFSAVADTAIKPTWCPPDPDDMDDITEQLRKLNDACLFNSLEDAKAYRQLYLAKKWADKELYEGQTTIIQIRGV